MSEWIYFIHAPRENFGATMTDEERAVWDEHVNSCSAGWTTGR